MENKFGAKLTKFLISSAISATFISCGMCFNAYAKTLSIGSSSISTSESGNYYVQDGDTIIFDPSLSSYDLSNLQINENRLKDAVQINIKQVSENLTEILENCKKKINEYKDLKFSDGTTPVFPTVLFGQAADSNNNNTRGKIIESDLTAIKTELGTLESNANSNFKLETLNNDIKNVVTEVNNLKNKIYNVLLAINNDKTTADAAFRQYDPNYSKFGEAEVFFEDFKTKLSKYDTEDKLKALLIPDKQSITIKYLGDSLKLTGNLPDDYKISKLILKKGVNGTSSITGLDNLASYSVEYEDVKSVTDEKQINQTGEKQSESEAVPSTGSSIVVPNGIPTNYPDMKLDNDRLNSFLNKSNVKHVNSNGDNVPGVWKWQSTDEDYKKLSPGDSGKMYIKFVASDGTETGDIPITIIKWGDKVVNDGINNYTTDGYTMVEVKSGKRSYLCENDRWFFVDNSDNVFEDGSQFWVKIITQSESPTEYETYKDLIDPSVLSFADDENKVIYLMGVTKSDGTNYEYLDGQVTVGIEIPSNWSLSDLMMYRLKSKEDTELITSLESAKLGTSGKSRTFLTFKTDHFSPYGMFKKKVSAKTASNTSNASGNIGTLLSSATTGSSSYYKTSDSRPAYYYAAFCALTLSSILIAKLSRRKIEE